MTEAQVPRQMVAAILSDLVYHSYLQVVTPPSGWEPVRLANNGQKAVYYDSASGYYGEAWGKIKTDPVTGARLFRPDGSPQYEEIMQVNRGTIASKPGAYNNTDPSVNLLSTFERDSFLTVTTDAQIVTGKTVSSGH